MKIIDVRFGSHEMELLKNMVGKTMTKYKFDPFLFSTAVFGIVGFVVEGSAYILTNTVRPMDYYGSMEDVAVMSLSQTEEEQIRSMLVNQQMVETPVGKKITRIDIVNEHQALFHNGVQTYDVQLTRGLIFHFDDASELSFEKNIWFSEDISIGKGEELIDRFTSVEAFSEDWEEGYRGECDRTVLRFPDGR